VAPGSVVTIMESSPDASVARAFRDFLTADWKQWLAEYPELATAIGVPGGNDRWADESATGRQRRRDHLESLPAALSRIDRAGLGAPDQFNYDLYRRMVETARVGVPLGFDPIPFDLGEPSQLRMPINQMDGLHLTAAQVLELAPRSSTQDYDDRLARLRALPRAADQLLSVLRESLPQGFTPPRIAVRGVPEQIRSLIPAEPEASGLLASFQDLPPSVGAADQTRLREESRRAYRDAVVPALQQLLEYIETTYLPGCRESIGASALPDGARRYAYLVRRNTTTELTPQQIHDIGIREVARLRSEMEGVMRKTGFTGSLEAFHTMLRTDRRFYWSSADDLVNAYRVIGKKTDPQLSRIFGRLPRLPYGVLPVPAYREAASPGAYYQSGAPSTGRAGYFYANTHRVDTRPKWEMEALSLHEAVPGHHLQLALAQELEGLPEFRRETGPTAFIEGWGLYAESLGEELGFYQDPYSKFGQLTFDMWRSLRLVVDTGMHALGWTRDRAIGIFRENTGMSDDNIAVEVDRYIVWPGQALAYKIGQLKFRELRTLAERDLGTDFDVRGFHDLVLGEGAIGLGEVERRVQSWIRARAAN
jgi:uncharacterized protein (DUF885 family)